MKKRELDKQLEQSIRKVVQKGIQIDQPQLTKDMCAQFSNDREWIREYVVNAKDANATYCQISGKETKDTTTIIVEDDGHGMNKKRLLDFFTIFRSVKIGDPATKVGRHGIGKLSVAAIPGQCGFFLHTSTGKECWTAETGSLLENKPVTLTRLENITSHGTRFEITFKKRVPLFKELEAIIGILDHYVKYMDLNIRVLVPFEEGIINVDGTEIPNQLVRIKTPWKNRETFSMTYHFDIKECHFEAVVEVGRSFTELYQNRVLIANTYSLFEVIDEKKAVIPHINIKVDSPDFSLPFGRHKLINEEILGPLINHIGRKTLPDFVNCLLDSAELKMANEIEISQQVLEDIAIAMMKYHPDMKSSWSNMRLFREYNSGKVSLADLDEMVVRKGRIFIEKEQAEGLDYSVLDGPVLFNNQPEKALDVIKTYFFKDIIDLGEDDCITEAPLGVLPKKDGREKRFEQFLGFFPDAWIEETQKKIEAGQNLRSKTMSNEDRKMWEGAVKNISSAETELRKIVWKTSYFMERDIKTPCTRLKFSYKNNAITLNLFHPEINQLLKLSEKSPALAAHWAMSLCLAEESKALGHFSPESRDTLLFLDALSKVGKLTSDEFRKQLRSGFNGLLRHFNDLNDETNN
jgi:hypothetical protein